MMYQGVNVEGLEAYEEGQSIDPTSSAILRSTSTLAYPALAHRSLGNKLVCQHRPCLH